MGSVLRPPPVAVRQTDRQSLLPQTPAPSGWTRGRPPSGAPDCARPAAAAPQRADGVPVPVRGPAHPTAHETAPGRFGRRPFLRTTSIDASKREERSPRYLRKDSKSSGQANCRARATGSETEELHGCRVQLGRGWSVEVGVRLARTIVEHDDGHLDTTVLAGIRPTEPGYRDIAVEPRIPRSLDQVSAAQETVRGR
ncbi:alpha-L-rhamnosidase C-terminal domain-containing protein, partial [Streptomyces javensis]